MEALESKLRQLQEWKNKACLAETVLQNTCCQYRSVLVLIRGSSRLRVEKDGETKDQRVVATLDGKQVDLKDWLLTAITEGKPIADKVEWTQNQTEPMSSETKFVSGQGTWSQLEEYELVPDWLPKWVLDWQKGKRAAPATIVYDCPGYGADGKFSTQPLVIRDGQVVKSHPVK